MILSLRSQLIITQVLQCIELGEDNHNRHLKDKKYQRVELPEKETTNLPLSVPKLKNSFSAPDTGRWSSIGTQYLLKYQKKPICYKNLALPDDMKLIL
jgi:hypothetical protein